MSRLALKLTALLVLLTGLPLAVAWWQSQTLFERSLGAGLNPVVATALQDAVGVYGAFVASEKGRQRAVARGLADSRALATAAAAGPDALRAALVPVVADPRVGAIELIATQGPPVRQAGRPMPTDAWLLDTEVVPLTGVPGYTHLRYEYGLERAVLTRFEHMEADVIRPFSALAADRENLADVYTYSFVGSLAAAVLIAALIAVVVGRRLTRRLRRLREGMARVASGERSARVTPAGHDELADLAVGFNAMAQRLEDSHARVQYLTQVSAWQGIARRLAHEIKNPLTPILLAVQQAHQSYKGDDPRYRRTLDTAREIVEQEVQTLKRLVEHFSRFAKLPAVSLTAEDLRGPAEDMVSAHPNIAGLAARLPDAPVRVCVDKGLLRQALTNLVKNADEANRALAEADRKVILTVDPCPDGGAQLHVDDVGPGVPAADRDRVFEPYVTGKHDGTGLGLAIVKKIVLDHGGEITVGEAPTGGARFTVRLPNPADAPVAPRTAPREEARP